MYSSIQLWETYLSWKRGQWNTMMTMECKRNDRYMYGNTHAIICCDHLTRGINNTDQNDILINSENTDYKSKNLKDVNAS